MATESPGTAFGLSLAGGVLIFIAGLILAALASFAAAVTGNSGILALGWLGSICGILIIALAVAFHSRPTFAKIGGALVIGFCCFSRDAEGRISAVSFRGMADTELSARAM